MSPRPQRAIEHRVDRGRHDVHWVTSGPLEVGIVPALGGRILSLRRDGRELLWRNPALLDESLQPVDGHVPAPHGGLLGDWRNYGGDKTWPAPQGWSRADEWAGPPDAVLDSGAYDVRVEQGDEVVLELTSGVEPRTGLRLSRRLTVRDDAGFDLELSAENMVDRPVTWALWNVSQLPGGGTTLVEVGPEFSEPVELAVGTGAPSWRRTATDEVEIGPQDVVGKLGFPGASGRLRYRRDGIDIAWSFEAEEGAVYPDGGSRVEVWTEHPQPKPIAHLDGLNPPDRIVECEVLSPLQRLEPGEVARLRMRVTVAPSEEHDS